MNAAQLRTAANVAEIQALQGCKVSAAYLHLYALHKGMADNGDRIYKLRQMPPEIAPKGAPVLVAGGIAMKKTGDEWFSGMGQNPFTRKLNWAPEWWSAIPNGNEPLRPTPPEEPPFWPCFPLEAGPFDANDDKTSLLDVAKQRLEEDGTGWI